MQLLPETSSCITTVGCNGWTTQHSLNNCPTAAPVSISRSNSNGSNSTSQGNSKIGTASAPLPTQSPATGDIPGTSPDESSNQDRQTAIVGTIGLQTITETFVLTTFSVLASLSSTVTTTTSDTQSESETLVIGPGGIA